MLSLSYLQRSIKILVICSSVLLVVYGLMDQRARASASGPSPSFTNAPGEGNCTSCHTSFEVNSGGGSVVITGLPTNYLPNQMILVTVRVTHPNAVVYGFELTALDQVGREAGALMLTNAVQTQLVQGLVGSFIRTYVEHTVDGVTSSEFNTRAWTFMWKAPSRRVGRVSFYVAGNGADSDSSPNGDYIYTSSSHTYSNSAASNFDGDGKTDLAVFRPTDGNWYILKSSNGAFSAQPFGTIGDKPVPGDFDGDGKHDVAVFRPSNGTWYILRSSTGTFSADAFGTSGDQPVVGDFDVDGKSDLAVYRPSNGTWYVLRSSNGALQVAQFGSAEDKAVAGDYDADGKSDFAVFRPSIGAWYVLRSSDGVFIGQQFGVITDKPVQGDYDGDGKTDIAVYRPGVGTWYIQQSTAGFVGYAFGISSDKPAPGDFDGDGKTDVTVFRNGTWYSLLSTNGSLRVDQFGAAGDAPMPAAYIPE